MDPAGPRAPGLARGSASSRGSPSPAGWRPVGLLCLPAAATRGSRPQPLLRPRRRYKRRGEREAARGGRGGRRAARTHDHKAASMRLCHGPRRGWSRRARGRTCQGHVSAPPGQHRRDGGGCEAGPGGTRAGPPPAPPRALGPPPGCPPRSALLGWGHRLHGPSCPEPQGQV